MATLNVTVEDGNNLNVQVTPQATQTIQINRGVAGPPGPNAIGGFPINVSNPSQYDVLMFGVGEWVNTSQTEITDGGNF